MPSRVRRCDTFKPVRPTHTSLPHIDDTSIVGRIRTSQLLASRTDLHGGPHVNVSVPSPAAAASRNNREPQGADGVLFQSDTGDTDVPAIVASDELDEIDALFATAQDRDGVHHQVSVIVHVLCPASIVIYVCRISRHDSFAQNFHGGRIRYHPAEQRAVLLQAAPPIALFEPATDVQSTAIPSSSRHDKNAGEDMHQRPISATSSIAAAVSAARRSRRSLAVPPQSSRSHGGDNLEREDDRGRTGGGGSGGIQPTAVKAQRLSSVQSSKGTAVPRLSAVAGGRRSAVVSNGGNRGQSAVRPRLSGVTLTTNGRGPDRGRPSMLPSDL